LATRTVRTLSNILSEDTRASRREKNLRINSKVDNQVGFVRFIEGGKVAGLQEGSMTVKTTGLAEGLESLLTTGNVVGLDATGSELGRALLDAAGADTLQGSSALSGFSLDVVAGVGRGDGSQAEANEGRNADHIEYRGRERL
jgi:hypothetical protein